MNTDYIDGSHDVEHNIILSMPEEDKFGYLWCLLNSMPDLNYAAAIKLMHEIENKLDDDKINKYWQIFISG